MGDIQKENTKYRYTNSMKLMKVVELYTIFYENLTSKVTSLTLLQSSTVLPTEE